MIEDPKILGYLEYISDRLSERIATLFLGAGVNAKVVDAANNKFPLGNGLADWISIDLLNDDNLHLPLNQVADIARLRVGPQQLNRFIYNLFAKYRPGVAQLSTIQLPWDVIYTTNYDLLLETAAEEHPENRAGVIRPICSMLTDISSFSEDDVPYYKLHGSVDLANTPEGRLILTQADYHDYRRLRIPLFSRLKRDLQRRTFVFVGYSLTDSNLREILERVMDLGRA